MKEISKKKSHLLAFMMEFTQDLDQEVRELSIYMFYNIFRMFIKSHHTSGKAGGLYCEPLKAVIKA